MINYIRKTIHRWTAPAEVKRYAQARIEFYETAKEVAGLKEDLAEAENRLDLKRLSMVERACEAGIDTEEFRAHVQFPIDFKAMRGATLENLKPAKEA